MSVPDTLDRIATILEGISGIQSVYAGRPNDVAPAMLPAFIVFTDAATIDEEADDKLMITRVYRPVLVVSAWTMNIELESEALCRPFFNLFEQAIVERPMLELTPGVSPLAPVVRCRYLGDSGVINIHLGGKDYAGVEFRVEITEVKRRIYS